MSGAGKQDAIHEVLDLMKQHHLSLEDIARALAEPLQTETQKSGSILSRLFGYVGGIFVFVGPVIYVGMRWETLDAAGRVLVTLGPGFAAFVMAIFLSMDQRTERAATPLFLLAIFLEPTGILVMLREYSRGGDPAHGLLYMHAVMAIQQGCAFKARDRTVLALSTVIFSTGFFVLALDLLEVNRHLIGVTIGLSLGCVAWSLGQSRHRAIAGLCYLAGSMIFLSTSYDWLDHGPAEIVFLGLACLTVFISVLARSRTLLVVGTLAMIGYIGEFMARHFADNLNAPLLLMLMGFILIVLGVLAVRINNKYIRVS